MGLFHHTPSLKIMIFGEFTDKKYYLFLCLLHFNSLDSRALQIINSNISVKIS